MGYKNNEHAKIVAVADINAAIAEEKRVAFGGDRSYADYHELLKDDSVDAVDICVPNFLHSKITVSTRLKQESMSWWKSQWPLL